VLLGKAFSYFASQYCWIGEVLYHAIHAESATCLLKTDCAPSQNVKNVRHQLWMALDKTSAAIRSAYCSCFAGYSLLVLNFQQNSTWTMHRRLLQGCPLRVGIN